MMRMLAVLVLCLTATACETGPKRMDLREGRAIPWKRVAVVEFADAPGYHEYGDVFSQALGAKLARWTLGTDVISVTGDEMPELRGAIRAGSIPAEALLKLRSSFRVDAVVIGSVDRFSPIPEAFSVRLTVKVVDTGTGKVLPCSLSRSWNAAAGDVQEDIRAYYAENRSSQRDEFRLGPNIYTTSPRYFLRYVADRVAEDIVENLAPARTEKSSE